MALIIDRMRLRTFRRQVAQVERQVAQVGHIIACMCNISSLNKLEPALRQRDNNLVQLEVLGCLVQVGKGIELEAVGVQYE